MHLSVCRDLTTLKVAHDVIAARRLGWALGLFFLRGFGSGILSLGKMIYMKISWSFACPQRRIPGLRRDERREWTWKRALARDFTELNALLR